MPAERCGVPAEYCFLADGFEQNGLGLDGANGISRPKPRAMRGNIRTNFERTPKMKKITTKLGAALVAGVLALGASAVSLAAEDASGVVKYIGLSYDSAKAAMESANAGKKDETLASLKQVRQYTKEITGDAAGMKLQKANQAVKAAGLEAEAGNLAKAAEMLAPAVATLEEMKKNAGK
ncbi:MAG: hypothetical protein ACKN9T_04340 [Candidatus Methylumidiphilus sp.]